MSNHTSSDKTVEDPTAAPSLPSSHRANAVPRETGLPRKKRGLVFWLGATVAIAGTGIWLANFIHHSMTFEVTDDAYINGHIYQVSSRGAGSVIEVLVSENEAVKAGQALARIDPLASQISLQKARAALAQEKAGARHAQAALNQAKAQTVQAAAQAASSEAQVRLIEAQLQMANVNFERNQRLFQSDAHAISKAEVDTTKSNAQASGAALIGAKADLTAAQARSDASAAAVESAEAEIATADARILVQEAGVRDAERELSYSEIVAPSDGRVGNKNVEPGNRVQVGQALFAVVGGDYWIVANFKETQIRNVRAGQRVEITVDAVDGHHFTGKVDGIAPATGAQFALLPADNATGNFTKVVQRVPVKIVFDRDSIRGFEERLRPGLSAIANVLIK
ncbi:MAG: HlyD family secretion protein [Chthoniobacteraceae bacterium]|nr:HlyD family secretion protein [Chthoniobacteraceae bacterium]